MPDCPFCDTPIVPTDGFVTTATGEQFHHECVPNYVKPKKDRRAKEDRDAANDARLIAEYEEKLTQVKKRNRALRKAGREEVDEPDPPILSDGTVYVPPQP